MFLWHLLQITNFETSRSAVYPATSAFMRVGGGDDSANSGDALGGYGIFAPQQSILKAKVICSFMEAYKLDIYIGSDNGSRKIGREYVDKITEWADRNFSEGYTLLKGIPIRFSIHIRKMSLSPHRNSALWLSSIFRIAPVSADQTSDQSEIRRGP